MHNYAPLDLSLGISLDPGGLSPPVATLREIGTRSSLPLLQAANTLQYNGRLSSFVRGGDISAIKVAWANFNVSSGTEQASGSVMTLTGSIEYPIGASPQTTPGTRTQLLFGGSATGTVASGGVLVSDLLTIAIPNNAQFRIWWHVGWSVNAVYFNGGPYIAPAQLGDGQFQSSTDFTMSGTFTDTSAETNRIGWPCRIMGMQLGAPTDVLIVGDSRSSGFGETKALQDSSGDCGEIARPIGAAHAYYRIGQNGQKAQLAVANHTLQDQVVNLCTPSRAIIVLGANDLSAGQTAAQIYANMQTLKARYAPGSIPCYLATQIPRTTSTDSWVTTANQTALATEAQRVALQAFILANSGGFTGVLDYGRQIFETTPDSGIWNVTGTSGDTAYTKDGIHPTATATKLVPVFSI